MASQRFEEGLAVRRAVLGEAYVDQAMASADDFTRPLQELVTEYCWGAIWTRPGLSRKTRSLINLAMLTALNRPHELKLHVRGALRNGCTKERSWRCSCRRPSTAVSRQRWTVSVSPARSFRRPASSRGRRWNLTTALELARATDTPAPFSARCRELWAAALV